MSHAGVVRQFLEDGGQNRFCFKPLRAARFSMKAFLQTQTARLSSHLPDSDEEPLRKKTDVREETKLDALDLLLVMLAADQDEQPIIFLGQRN